MNTESRQTIPLEKLTITGIEGWPIYLNRC
jgi:hypothetical protein